MYFRGDGVLQDHEEAIKWYRLATEQGNGLAQMGLGLAYISGEGVTRDYEEARRFLTLSAEKEPHAQYTLGALYYEKGTKTMDFDCKDGLTSKDTSATSFGCLVSAHKWLNISITNLDARTKMKTRNNAIKNEKRY
jgi:TPR repeat protein